MTFIAPDRDLLWLYTEADGAMGLGAQSWGDSMAVTTHARQVDRLAGVLEPGWISAPTPTKRQLHAARRQRWLLGILRGLEVHHRRAIEAAYGHRHAVWATADATHQSLASGTLGDYLSTYRVHGIAAGAVLRVAARDRGRALERVEAAHVAWGLEREIHITRQRRDRERAETAAQLRREAYVAETTGQPDVVVVELRARAAWRASPDRFSLAQRVGIETTKLRQEKARREREEQAA